MRQIKMNKHYKLFIYLPVPGIYLHPPQSQIIWKKPIKLWSYSLYISSGQLQYFQICSLFIFCLEFKVRGSSANLHSICLFDKFYFE